MELAGLEPLARCMPCKHSPLSVLRPQLTPASQPSAYRSLASRHLLLVDRSLHGRRFASPSPCPSHQGRGIHGLAILRFSAYLKFPLCIVQECLVNMLIRCANPLSPLWERVGVRGWLQAQGFRVLRFWNNDATLPVPLPSREGDLWIDHFVDLLLARRER